jgi:NAD-dependent dihydropyrimidine dehydrogenase PreA subunit
MNLFPFLHLRETRFIHLSPRQCQGCWKCVEVCPAAVFVKMARSHHGHVHIKDPNACNGCKKCVRACAYHAIKYIYIPSPRDNTSFTK